MYTNKTTLLFWAVAAAMEGSSAADSAAGCSLVPWFDFTREKTKRVKRSAAATSTTGIMRVTAADESSRGG